MLQPRTLGIGANCGNVTEYAFRWTDSIPIAFVSGRMLAHGLTTQILKWALIGMSIAWLATAGQFAELPAFDLGSDGGPIPLPSRSSLIILLSLGVGLCKAQHRN